MDKAVFIFTPSHQQQEYLETVLDSIAANISIPYQFCLFTDKLNLGFSSKYNLIVKIIDEEDLNKMKSLYFREGRADIPAFSAYAQFVLPRYFPELDYFLYMEVDQIVRGDLAPLWFECIEQERVLSAARFLDDYYLDSSTKSFNALHPGKTCFNTGVLFVNCKYWIDNKFELMCFKELQLQKETSGERLQFYAQGAIVNALHKYIEEFDWIYNTPGFGSVRGIDKNVLKEAIVLHWTGSLKPWKENGLYKDLYYFDPNLLNEDDYKAKFVVLKKIKIKIKKLLYSLLE